MKNFLLSISLLIVSLFAFTGCSDDDDVTPEANCFTNYTEFVKKLAQDEDLCTVYTEYYSFLKENKSCVIESSNGALSESDIDLILQGEEAMKLLYCN
ncbi:hypothetical protein [Flammeovirga sp. SJP92]|uniref:hypothetical protein n=1 Tax=Flammeovirga sp. SJP92 TaxID=1775430 RepID=UPI000787F73C|nr:hypothetical protein [Flammeovirga sp. SJP92]KXX67917.1 hypothetical protein AVL50_23965 [Flammeovirga sp. SJP92]